MRVAPGQLRQLPDEGLVELVGMAAVVAVAGAGVEQRVAAEERRRVGVREQADVAHRVPRGIERFELDGAADRDHVSGPEPLVHVRNARTRVRMGEDLRTRRLDHGCVAADVVAVLVGVEDLRDLEPPCPLPQSRHLR